ncbi:hypothetical protein SCWH03_10690 [Streptomyces pacificus]|uniref:Uncharacterized protein n=1 Tax=Streptomyces pacificus TaxID=2705029 RepID=A0A6A0AQU7_9ACTN|nr:hypothetical protein SCWH03_10690 [Streptomyces pacificus]
MSDVGWRGSLRACEGRRGPVVRGPASGGCQPAAPVPLFAWWCGRPASGSGGQGAGGVRPEGQGPAPTGARCGRDGPGAVRGRFSSAERGPAGPAPGGIARARRGVVLPGSGPLGGPGLGEDRGAVGPGLWPWALGQGATASG